MIDPVVLVLLGIPLLVLSTVRFLNRRDERRDTAREQSAPGIVRIAGSGGPVAQAVGCD